MQTTSFSFLIALNNVILCCFKKTNKINNETMSFFFLQRRNDVVFFPTETKRRRFFSYKDETTSFQQSHVPKRETLVPSRAEMQIARGGGGCKTRENSNFLKNDKMVISIKIQNFSRSWMTKRTSPLKLSREI